MSGPLKVLDPASSAELAKIFGAENDPEALKRYDDMQKQFRDLEQIMEQNSRGESASPPANKPNNKIGARKDGVFKAVSTAPSFNRTPVGPSMVPLPYPTTIDLSNSVDVASNVRFNGKPVYTLASSQPNCKGDERGSGGGVRSGTVNGTVKPTGASTSVRVQGKRVVRDGDPNTMNGGNNPGIYITAAAVSNAAPANALATSNPPVVLETPQEKSAFKKWLHQTEERLRQAMVQPVEGLKGAVKGIVNIPSNSVELLLKAAAEQRATELQEAAVTQAVFGQTDAAKTMAGVAAETRAQGERIDVPKFTMNNPAQEGGDLISTAVQLFAGGVGLIKGAVKGLGRIGRAGTVKIEAKIPPQVKPPTVSSAENPATSASGNTVDGVHIAAKPAKYSNTSAMKSEYVGEDVKENFARGGKKVQYLSKTELAAHEVIIKDGLLYDSSGRLLNSPDYPGIFVMSTDGEIYFADAATAVPGEFHHSSFLSGKPVAAAGELDVKNGEIQLISAASGHYKPSSANLDQFLNELTHQNVPNANNIPIMRDYE